MHNLKMHPNANDLKLCIFFFAIIVVSKIVYQKNVVI
jgi:hypothetical protein